MEDLTCKHGYDFGTGHEAQGMQFSSTGVVTNAPYIQKQTNCFKAQVA